jgi:hypothetical protein
VSDLEAPFLEQTKQYYQWRVNHDWLHRNDFPGYILQAEKAFYAEEQRVRNYLHSSTMRKLKDLMLNVLFETQLQHLLKLDHGFLYLLEKEYHSHTQTSSSTTSSSSMSTNPNIYLQDLERAFRHLNLVKGNDRKNQIKGSTSLISDFK